MSAQSLLTTSSHLFLVALVLAGLVHTLPMPALDSTLSNFFHVTKVSKSSLLNPTVDILVQLQIVEDVFVSDVVSSCHSLNLSQTRHLKNLNSVRLCCL